MTTPLLTGEALDHPTAAPAPARSPIDSAHRARDYITRRALGIADAIAITIALALAELVVNPSPEAIDSFTLSLVTVPLWVALFKVYGLYDRDAKRISHSTVDDLPHLANALVLGSLGLWAYSKLALPDRLEFVQGATFFLSAFVLITIARVGVRTAVAPRFARERVALVGEGPMAQVLVRKILTHPEYGLDPIGYFATDSGGASIEGAPYLGDPVTELEVGCERLDVQRVVVVATGVEEDVLVDVIRACSELNLKVGVVPNLVDVLGSAVETDHLEGVAVLGMSPPVFSRSSKLIKRAMDVTITAGVLILTAPLILVAAAAIKLTSEGPVFFAQDRIGRGGRKFRIYKLRTMVVDAETREADLRSRSRHPAWLLLDDDPRVTRVGRLLRRTSIDELPQLFNVLKGDMSLVGPRPMPPAVDEQIEGWGRRRLDLTPGITGLWQALGRTSIPFEEMVNLDYLYVTNWSLWQDIRLLLRTLPTVVSRRGVN